MSSVSELLNSVGDLLSGGLDKVTPGAASQPKTGGLWGDGTYGILPERAKRILGAGVPKIAANLASAPTDLWALIDESPVIAKAIGDKMGFNTSGMSGQPWGLPGAEGAKEISTAIQKPANELAEKIAQEPISENLLTGDPAQLAGAWSRLLTGAIITAPINAPRVATGIKALDTMGNATIGTLEAVSPVLLSKNPTPGIIAANLGGAAVLGAGMEAVLGSAPTPQQAKAQADEVAKGVADSAAQGVEEAKKVTPVQAGFSTGSDYGDAAALAGMAVGGAALLSYWKRGAAYRALTGLDKGETSFMPASTIAREQLGDFTAPIDYTVRKHVGAPTGFGSDYKGVGPNNRGYTLDQARDIADSFESRMASRTGASVDTKIQLAYTEGRLPDSNIQIEPLDNWLTRYKNLNPAQQKEFMDYINARHEIDTRQNLAKEKYTGTRIGQTGSQTADHIFENLIRQRWYDDVNLRHNMYETDTKDLFNIVRNTNMDPAARQVADSYLSMMEKMPTYLYEQRALTKQEQLSLRRVNPHYVATKLSDGGSHLSRENPGPHKGLLNPGNPAEELPKYFDEIIRFAESNKVRREFLGTMERAAMAGDPFAKSIIGRTDRHLHNSRNASDLTVRFRDVDGRARDIEIKDPVLRRALNNVGRPGPLTAISGGMRWMAGMGRFFENSAVGHIGTVLGNPFAPVSALYSATAGTAFRDKRLGAAGWLDVAVQHATKGKFGVRGDPTLIADALLMRAPQGIAAVAAQRASRILQNSIISNGRTASYISKAMGPQAAQQMADAAAHYFKKSWVHELQMRAQLGPSSLMSVDPSKRLRDATSMLKQHNLAIRSVGGTFGLIGDILHAVSSSPAASIMAMNKNRNVAGVNKMMREFSGDPSRSGAFAGGLAGAAGKLTAASPWGNIFIQANIRLARAFKQNPVATTVGVFNAVGLPTIMALMHNASSGPEYVDYQYNIRTPDRQAGYLYVAIPGLPPHMGLEIPIEPSLRVFRHGVDVLAASTMGLMDGSIFKPGNEALQEAMKEMSGFRQKSFNEKTVLKSAVEQSITPPVPPVAAAGLAAVGIKMRSMIDTQAIPENTKNGFTTAEGRNPLRPWETAQTEELISAVGADSMRFLYNVLSDMAVGEKHFDKNPATTFGQSYMQRVKDSTKYASGPLFDHFMTISPSNEASGALIKEKVEGVKNFLEAYKAVTDRGAIIGNNVGSAQQGYKPSMGVGPQLPQDPRLLQLGEILSRAYPVLDKEFLGATRPMYDERARISANVGLSPTQRRALMNSQALDIVETNRQMLQRIQLIENNLSKRFGMPIKFDKLSPGGKMENFK